VNRTNFSNLGNSLTAAVVSEGVQSLVYGDDFDFAAVASQSLGYAIGNSLFSTVDAKEQMLEHIELQNGGGRAAAEWIYQQSYSNRVVSGEDAVFDTLTERQMYELQYGDQADAMMARTESQRVSGEDAVFDTMTDDEYAQFRMGSEEYYSTMEAGEYKRSLVQGQRIKPMPAAALAVGQDRQSLVNMPVSSGEKRQVQTSNYGPLRNGYVFADGSTGNTGNVSSSANQSPSIWKTVEKAGSIARRTVVWREQRRWQQC